MPGFILLNDFLLLLLIVTSLVALHTRNLLGAAIVMSLYSFLMSLVRLNLDAVDVAFTEAAVGAGVATVLFIGALVLVGAEEKGRPRIHWPAVLLVGLTAVALAYGTLDMPAIGDPQAPVQTHLAPQYIAQNVRKISASSADPAGHGAAPGATGSQGRASDYFHGHVPNMVTSVIVNYRALDTLFEVAVIFTAGVSLVLLLRGRGAGS
ncbi:MAG TPA: hydrogenase subunit MbhD domain-containing protein [Candidatus Binatia bacterium]